MSRQRFISLFFAALLAISGAMYLSTQRNLPRDLHGTALLPSLASELNTVSVLSVRKGSAAPTVTVHQQLGQWTVAERSDYPADVSKLRKLLLALSDTKIIEEKTSNPANFPIIGVEDPSVPGATSAEISFVAQDGKHAVIIGKSVGEGNFARRGGENKTYTVEPGISFEAEPRFWIDSHLIDIAVATIQRIEVKPAAGPVYSVYRISSGDSGARPGSDDASRSNSGSNPSNHVSPTGNGNITPGDSSFSLDGVPAGRSAADPRSLAPSPTTYGNLTADDVAPVADIDFSKATIATVTLSDGNVITFTGAPSGDKHWIQLKASNDAALTAKVAGRAFEISSYRYDAIFRPLEQLLVPKEPPPGANKGNSPANAVATSKRLPTPKRPPTAPTP